MKNSTKLHIYAAVAAGLALSPMAAHGQASPAATGAETTTYNSTTTDDRGDRREHHNYGWIGLLGLLGLAGLMRKNRDDVARYNTTTTRRSDVGSADV
jgi:MYXO-CTERM domain-containing protein